MVPLESIIYFWVQRRIVHGQLVAGWDVARRDVLLSIRDQARRVRMIHVPAERHAPEVARAPVAVLGFDAINSIVCAEGLLFRHEHQVVGMPEVRPGALRYDDVGEDPDAVDGRW